MDLMSTTQLLGNLGEFVGAIAVVATLAYLAVQIKQSSTSALANTYQSWVSANVGINVAMSNAHQSKMILVGNLDSTKLTEDSAGGYLMLHLAMFQMGQATDYLYRAGSLDRDLWDAEMNRLALVLRTPAVRQMWEAGVRSQLAPSFVELLEARQGAATYVDWNAEQGFYTLDLPSID